MLVKLGQMMIKENLFYKESQLAFQYVILWIILRHNNESHDTIINLRPKMAPLLTD